MSQFYKKQQFWYYVLGSYIFFYGIYVTVTGDAGRLISAGEGRYWVGGISIGLGLYIIILALIEDIKNRPK